MRRRGHPQRGPKGPRKPKPPPATSVKAPTDGTLKRHGLTRAEWQEMLDRQGGVCAITGEIPERGILHIDHEHLPGGVWRRMRPWERKRYVRGLVSPRANMELLTQYMSLPFARAIVRYLEAYEARRPTSMVKPGKRAHRAVCVCCGGPFGPEQGGEQVQVGRNRWAHRECNEKQTDALLTAVLGGTT